MSPGPRVLKVCSWGLRTGRWRKPQGAGPTGRPQGTEGYGAPGALYSLTPSPPRDGKPRHSPRATGQLTREPQETFLLIKCSSQYLLQRWVTDTQPSMPLLCKDYFKLKATESSRYKKRSWPLVFVPRSRTVPSHWEGIPCLQAQKGDSDSYHQRWGLGSGEVSTDKPYQRKIDLHQFLTLYCPWKPKPSFLY